MMKEALKVADAYLLAHIRDLGIDRDPRQYDFSVQAVNLNQAKEGSETAIGFFISLVSALLERPVDPTAVVMGEMSVKGLLQKVADLPQRLELARDAGAKRVLMPEREQARHRRRAGRTPQSPPDGLLYGSAQRRDQGDGPGMKEPGGGWDSRGQAPSRSLLGDERQDGRDRRLHPWTSRGPSPRSPRSR